MLIFVLFCFSKQLIQFGSDHKFSLVCELVLPGSMLVGFSKSLLCYFESIQYIQHSGGYFGILTVV
jgi:hypothetical protein